MRQRITYLHNATDQFDPNSLRLTDQTLSVAALRAAKEHRVTLGLAELPQELRTVLKQCQELYVRWASPRTYTAVAPFVSRITPGLHVFYTPRAQKSADLLCGALKKVFGDQLKCRSPEASFTAIPMLSERFSTSTAYEYYQPLESLGDLAIYAQQKFCNSASGSCHDAMARLLSADFVSVDYDTISHMLVLNAFWDGAPSPGVWEEEYKASNKQESFEIGVLANEKPVEPEEIKLGGWLSVIGEDDKPKPTLFSFPSRHHLSPAGLNVYTVSLLKPTGLHPTLRISFPSPPATSAAPSESCALHTYLTLPSYLFIDKYQLSDPLFLASKNLHSMRALHGEADLEAPDWVIEKWGSRMLAEIAVPSRSTASESVAGGWHVDIPLHLRYLSPSDDGLTDVPVPWPVVFWACDAEDGLKMSVNPFDRVHLGYDGLFGPKTMFYHLTPSSESLVETLRVPVLDLGRATWVEAATAGVIALGFAWVCWRIAGVYLGGRRTAQKNAELKKEKKKA